MLVTRKRPVGSLPPSKPPPARHRPGARSARRDRCLSILSQTGREAMKRYRSTAGLVLAVLGVLSLAGPVAAGEQVPFKGRLEGDVTVTPLVPPRLQVDVEAAGNATHLGWFTLDIPHLVNAANGTAI